MHKKLKDEGHHVGPLTKPIVMHKNVGGPTYGSNLVLLQKLKDTTAFSMLDQ